jgi:hypothetical protein
VRLDKVVNGNNRRHRRKNGSVEVKGIEEIGADRVEETWEFNLLGYGIMRDLGMNFLDVFAAREIVIFSVPEQDLQGVTL